tara:strand:+ start:1117 stop:3516 length:2400 start_codon:yes stop_codon:yes gene_type:complete
MKTIFAFLIMTATSMAATLNVPSQYATVQSALTDAQPGDTVLIAAGTYNEVAATARSGTESQRITIDGQGVATISKLTIGHSYYTMKRMRISSSRTQWDNVFIMNGPANYNIIQDCEVDALNAYKVNAFAMTGNNADPTSCPSFNIIERNLVKNVKAYTMMVCSGRENIVRNNTFRDCIQSDFLRLMGVNNLIQDNKFLNNTPQAGLSNHPDFVQTFGNNGEQSYGHIIERNIINGVGDGQIFQLSATGQPNVRDWTVRNNIFANITLGGGGNMPGMKIYNNIFYRIGTALGFSYRTFGYKTGIDEFYPIYGEMTQPTPSGSLVAEGDGGQYRYGGYYQVRAPEVLLGTALIPGKVYIARTRGSGKIVYNGTEYLNQQTFTCLPGITTWTETYTNAADAEPTQLFYYAQLTYRGVTYNREAWFQCNADTRTYTVNQPEAGPWRVAIDFAHRTQIIGNVFLDCGAAGAWQAFYGIDLALKDCVADYNYVGKDGYQAVLTKAQPTPIGDPAGWGGKGWYEVHGINGGNPKFTDESNLDFRLQPTSPLINTGTVISDVNSDFINTPRPLGAAPDIGAYEYDDGSPPPVVTPGSPPIAPTLLTASATGATTATIGWTDNATNESIYEVERSLNGSTWTKTNSLAANSTSLTITGLAASTLYYWRVRAVNGDGNSAYTNTASATTQAPPVINLPPAAPTNFQTTAIGANSVTMNWDDNATDETGYVVACSPDGVSWSNVATLGPNVASWTNSGLVPASTYYYRVRAVNQYGNSAWSNDDATTTAASPPPRSARAQSSRGDLIGQ